MAKFEEQVDEELLDEELEEEEGAGGGGFLDSLSDQFGSAPWWVISGAFHGLMILLVFLIGMVVMQAKQDSVVIATSLEKPVPPEYDEKKERDIFKKPVPLDENQEPIENPVVTHEVVEFADHNETDDNMDDNQARGDENAISDVPLGGTGTVAAIGLGGGGGGAFGHRGVGGRRRLAMRGGGGKATESAVDAALRWLAKHQEADGHWDCQKYGGKQADVAMCGLALLAFLGAGHTEKVGQYKDNVTRAVAWMKSIQNADGSYFKNGETHGIGYHHAIAGLAMAEAAGMGRVPGTVASAQKGVDYSIDIHQKGDASEKLGWRYAAKSATGDISVSGWFIMQLKSAKVAGLKVDPAGFDGAIKFLDSVQNKGAGGGGADASFGSGGHVYGYTDANSVSHRRTAIGCLGRQFLGWKKEDLQGGVDWFVNKGGVPNWGANGGSVDLYYWYYGTLCVFQQGGDVWKNWNESMKKALCDNQRRGGDEDGSWDPVGDYSGYWGRVGQTALGCLCLEVYYRYLPLYKE
ncbi:MAG: terpene cyclase/mutase family protein [Planctomycetes bacterium]|nr:terpene cyclase/mutase family protein [Planctomycetota bacterium]